jgi:hypothetical protein
MSEAKSGGARQARPRRYNYLPFRSDTAPGRFFAETVPDVTWAGFTGAGRGLAWAGDGLVDLGARGINKAEDIGREVYEDPASLVLWPFSDRVKRGLRAAGRKVREGFTWVTAGDDQYAAPGNPVPPAPASQTPAPGPRAPAPVPRAPAPWGTPGQLQEQISRMGLVGRRIPGGLLGQLYEQVMSSSGGQGMAPNPEIAEYLDRGPGASGWWNGVAQDAKPESYLEAIARNRRAPAPRMDYHSPARMAQRAGASYMSAPVLPFGGSAAVARYNDPMSPGADAWHRERMNDGTAHSWEQAASRVATKARTGQDFAKATGQRYPAMLGRDAGILPVRQDRADRLVNRALMG